MKTKTVYYIEYLNKEKNFQKDKVIFKGKEGYEDAKKWGKENLENFNRDMINSKEVKVSRGMKM